MRTRVDRHDRETFIAALLKQVPTATREDALRLLRWGRTYARLAEAQCNGDYPAEGLWHDPTRKGSVVLYCKHCQSGYAARSFVRGFCPSCRAERIIRETCERMATYCETCGESTCLSENSFQNHVHRYGPVGHPFKPIPWVVPHFQGDPRGHTVRLQIAGAPLDAYERPALAVPTS